MAHHHKHDHATEHHHAPMHNQGRIFIITIALNMVFVAIEFSYGFIGNSTALMGLINQKNGLSQH